MGPGQIAAKIEHAMPHDIADGEAGLEKGGGIDRATGLGREEQGAFHRCWIWGAAAWAQGRERGRPRLSFAERV